MSLLFDERLQQIRLARMRSDPAALFLHERAFADVIDRLHDVRRPFDRTLLFGSPSPEWQGRLEALAGQVTDIRHGNGLTWQRALHGLQSDGPGYDLIVAIGILELLNDLPAAVRILRALLADGGMFAGAMLGGDSLPLTRAAMSEADRVSGIAAPHVHPRIDAPSLAALLSSAGLVDAVVDIDRVNVRYADFGTLVADLRAMGATNVLTARRPTPLTRAEARAADAFFSRAGDGERSTETFEILHFAAWSPAK